MFASATEEWLLPEVGGLQDERRSVDGLLSVWAKFGLPVRLPNESRQFRREVGVEIQI